MSEYGEMQNMWESWNVKIYREDSREGSHEPHKCDEKKRKVDGTRMSEYMVLEYLNICVLKTDVLEHTSLCSTSDETLLEVYYCLTYRGCVCVCVCAFYVVWDK